MPTIEGLGFNLANLFTQQAGFNQAKKISKRGFRDQLSLAAPGIQTQRNAFATLGQLLGLPSLDLQASVRSENGGRGISPFLADVLGSSGQVPGGAGAGAGGTGGGALDFLESLPFIQAEREAANKEFENSAAARGGLLTGQAVKARDELNRRLTRGQFQSHLDNLFRILGFSQAGTSAGIGASRDKAANLAGLTTKEYGARGSAYGAVGTFFDELAEDLARGAGFGAGGG